MKRPPTDPYRYLEPLGEGGAGRVWLVEDTRRPGSRVALKELTGAGSSGIEELRNEFLALASLKHPNLVEVREFGPPSTEGVPRFTLEYVEGVDVVSAISLRGTGSFVPLAVEALRAISFLHDFGWIHRDLKPANMLVRRIARDDCELVILDFGLALHGRSDQASHPAGTLPYLAPELLTGGAASRRSDLYGLGAVLFESLVGRPPFEPEDGGDLSGFLRRVSEGIQAPPPVPSGLPDRVGEWLFELLRPDPADRPASASEALARLNTLCGTGHPEETIATRAARLASGSPVGRDEEIARVRSLLSDLEGPSVVLIAGDAGSGKSRLLRWLSNEGVRENRRVEFGLPGGDDRPDGSSEQQAQAMITRLEETAGDQVRWVVLDELETAPGAVVRLLERLAVAERGPSFRVLGAVRAAEARGGLQNLLGMADLFPAIETVELRPMGADSIRAMVSRVTGSSIVDSTRVDWLSRASDGVAIQLESLLVDGAWETGETVEQHAIVSDSLRRRLNRIGDDAIAWLRALAVLGPGSPPSSVRSLAGQTEQVADQAAAVCQSVGLVEDDEGRWTPASRWVASAVLAGTPPEAASELHRSAAAIVESGGYSDPGRLARLWREAGDPSRSIAHALEAAERSEKELDLADSADWMRYAIAQLSRRDPRRGNLRLRHAQLLGRAERHYQAAKALATAARMANRGDDRDEYRVRRVRELTLSGRFSFAGSTAKRLESSIVTPRARTRLKLESGRLLMLRGAYDETIECLDAVSRQAESAGWKDLLCDATYLTGITLSNLRRLDEALPKLLEALRLARELENPLLEATSLIALAIVEIRASRTEEVDRYSEQAREVVEKHALLRLQVSLLATLANRWLEDGSLDRALALGLETEPLALRVGQRTLLTQSRANRAEALLRAGRPGEAVALLTQVLDAPRDGTEAAFIVLTEITLTEALLELPSPPFEEITTRLAHLLANESQYPRYDLAVLLVEMERRVAAPSSEPVEPIWERFHATAEKNQIEPEPEFLTRAHLALARSLLEANPARVLEQAGNALTLSEKNDQPTYAAQACAVLAEAKIRLGDSAAADKFFERGRAFRDEAADRIEDPELRRSFLDRTCFAPLRRSRSVADSAGEERLLAVYEMIRVLNSETDPEQLLETMLDQALNVVRAERGMILLRGDGEGEFATRLARNLEHETIEEAEDFSRNVVMRAGAGKSVLAMDTGSDERLRDLKSVSMFGIRSVLAVPLRLRGRIVGAVYLDNRSEGRLFTPDDLRFLEAFADHAALALENARVRTGLERANRRLEVAAESRDRFGKLIGRSAPMQQVYDLITKVADSDLSVLIQGPSGSGKELVARAIHELGPRRKKPCLTENCAALTETLLESELFGHVKGAFTGADRERVGLFEQADGGTLFLDEIGDMSPGMQARLLRVLQEGEMRRVGGEQRIQVDVRVLAATHRDLQTEVGAGNFREDLLYRLQVLVIQLPALCDRPGDVPLLVEHFLERISRERDRTAPELDAGVMGLLERYAWPGNVRQLESTIQRLSLLAGENPIDVGTVESNPALRTALLGEGTTAPAVLSMQHNEKQQMRQALEATRAQDRAAKLLGISRATIFRKIKEYGLS